MMIGHPDAVAGAGVVSKLATRLLSVGIDVLSFSIRAVNSSISAHSLQASDSTSSAALDLGLDSPAAAEDQHGAALWSVKRASRQSQGLGAVLRPSAGGYNTLKR
jgi:hypothetical protein